MVCPAKTARAKPNGSTVSSSVPVIKKDWRTLRRLRCHPCCDNAAAGPFCTRFISDTPESAHITYAKGKGETDSNRVKTLLTLWAVSQEIAPQGAGSDSGSCDAAG